MVRLRLSPTRMSRLVGVAAILAWSALVLAQRAVASESEHVDGVVHTGDATLETLGHEWEELATSLWRRTVWHADGTQTVETVGVGVEAMEWLAETEWLPRIQELLAERHEEAPHSGMRPPSTLELAELHARLATLARWQQVGSGEHAAQSSRACAAYRSVSATAAPGQPGARSSASARSCTGTSFVRASAWSIVPENWTRNYSDGNPGEEVSVSALMFGTPCGSTAWAEAMPLFAITDGYSCP